MKPALVMGEHPAKTDHSTTRLNSNFPRRLLATYSGFGSPVQF